MFYGIYFLIHTYKNTHTYIHSYNSRKLLSVWKLLLRLYSNEEWLFFCDCPKSELGIMYACHGYDTRL